MMNLREFRNGIRALSCLDRHELEEFGLFRTGNKEKDEADWAFFRDKPVKFFIFSGEDTADKVWQALDLKTRT